MKRKQIIIIAGLIVAGILASGVLLAPRVVRQFFYPPAPAMPAVVSKSVVELLAELENAIKSKAPQVLDQMHAPLADEEISALERRAGIQLPEEIKALYRWHNGCRSQDPRETGPIPGHRFVPLDEALGLATVLSNQVAGASALQRTAFGVFAGHRKSWIPLFDDGAGDGYFFDPQRKPNEGAVFYCFAEDATYTFFPSVRNLLAGALKCYEEGAFSWKDGPSDPGLEEDFERSQKIWDEFGASNLKR
jgi:cell wall assembly regulator SMI1